jgi:hypothetical protein
VPDTPTDRAAFGSAGTGDDCAPFPQVRALPLNDAATRGLLRMPHGPAGTDKAAEQKLLDRSFPAPSPAAGRDQPSQPDPRSPGDTPGEHLNR